MDNEIRQPSINTLHERANALIHIMDQLIEVLKMEVEIVRGRQKDRYQSDLPVLQKRKAKLTQIYHGHATYIKEHSIAMQSMDEDVRVTLKSKSKDFENAVKENTRVLDIARKSSERLAATIMQAIRDSKQQATTYSEGFSFEDRSKKSISISLDTEI